MSRSTCVMYLEETRSSSFISCEKTWEEELASGTQTPTCHQVLSWAGSPGATTCQNLLPLPGRPGMAGVPTIPMELCEGLCPAVVGGEVTEGQPGWEGQEVSPGGEGSFGCCVQDCESEKPLRSRHMQTHVGCFTNSSKGPGIPHTVDQGLGPRGGF